MKRRTRTQPGIHYKIAGIMMKTTLALLFSVLTLLAAPLAALAERVDGLYEAEVWVTDQTTKTRADALRVALGEVLVKVSGDARLTENPFYATALGQADGYLQQYRYKEAGDGGRQVLWVRFETSQVNQLLRSGGATLWGEVRPLTLVWLVVEQDGQRQLVSANDNSALQRELQVHAYRRALPVRLPLLDLTDLAKVSAVDLWGGFHDKTLEASARYQAQVILIGRLAATANGFQADWHLYNSDQVVRWSISGADATALVHSGIDTTTLRLANWFGQASSTTAQASIGPVNDRIRVLVNGVDSLGSYQRVSRYLNALPGVGDLQVEEVDGRNLILRLTAKGGMVQLQRTIALGDVLATAVTAQAQPGELVFDYLP